MSAFDYKVVDGFIRTMERNGSGLATQSNAFDLLSLDDRITPRQREST
jgi:hypothetical protein